MTATEWKCRSELHTSHHQVPLRGLARTFAVWGAACVSSSVSWSCSKCVVENVWTQSLWRKSCWGPFGSQGELWWRPALNGAADGYQLMLLDLWVHEELQVGGRIWGQTVAAHFNTFKPNQKSCLLLSIYSWSTPTVKPWHHHPSWNEVLTSLATTSHVTLLLR